MHPKRTSSTATSEQLLRAARDLARTTATLQFEAPVSYVYRPLDYAWPVVEQYLSVFGDSRKEVVLVGMNPGPFGMAQTGVPFGEVQSVRDWMKLDAPVGAPDRVHPRRPVLGFACPRSEVSGRRLWGTIAQRHPDPRDFFRRAFVVNYCPLLFLSESGANVTPDKLRAGERRDMEAACDAHLARVVDALRPKTLVGVGHYAAQRVGRVTGRKVVCLPHPSPASPQANRGWDKLARAVLEEAGVHELL